MGQGRENVKNMLKENREMFDRIEHDVKVKLGLIKEEAKAADASEE
jgi:hypothetical protein